MEPDRLNRWLTLGANLAVLVGLVFLVIEIKQNNDMVMAQTRSAISYAIIDNTKKWQWTRESLPRMKNRNPARGSTYRTSTSWMQWQMPLFAFEKTRIANIGSDCSKMPSSRQISISGAG